MIHILEDSTHKIEGQPPKKGVSWVLGTYRSRLPPSQPRWTQDTQSPLITESGKNPFPNHDSYKVGPLPVINRAKELL